MKKLLLLIVFVLNLSSNSFGSVNDSILYFDNLLKTIDYSKPQNFILYDFVLCDAESFVNNVESKPNLYDTVSFVLLKQNIAKNRTTLYGYLQNYEYWLCKKSDEYLLAYDTITACSLLENALNINRFYIIGVSKLVAIKLLQNKAVEVQKYIIDIAGFIHPNLNNYYYFTSATEQIYSYLIRKGNKFMINGDYYESLVTLNLAKNYYDTLPVAMLIDKHSALIVEAHTGICRSFLSVASRSILAARLDLAEKYYFQTINYINSHPHLNSLTSEIQNVRDMIIYSWFDKALTYKKANNIIQIQTIVAKLQTLCDSNSNDKPSLCFRLEELLIPTVVQQVVSQNLVVKEQHNKYQSQKIKKKKGKTIKRKKEYVIENKTVTTIKYPDEYLIQLITKAKYHYYLSEYSLAIDLFNTAKEYQLKNQITYDSLNYFIALSAKPLLYKYIENTHFLIWKNLTDSAANNIKNIKDSIKFYYLTQDKAILSALNNLENTLQNKLCNNNKQYIATYEMLAEKSAKELHYTDALVYIEKILSILNLQKHCQVDSSVYIKILRSYNIPSTYQKYINSAYNYVVKKDYSSSINFFYKADSLYKAEKLINYGLTNQTLADFSIAIEDKTFMIFAIKHLINNNESKQSLDILKELRKQGYLVSYSKDIQKSLGINIANIESNNKNNLEYIFLKYNIEDKWYKEMQIQIKKTLKISQGKTFSIKNLYRFVFHNKDYRNKSNNK